eukprot:jgi/Picsp_1/3652/NSC_06489-R1_ran gtpase binding
MSSQGLLTTTSHDESPWIALWKGSFLLKHGRQGKPKVHYFTLTADCTALSWTRVSGTTRQIELTWVRDVMLGHVSQTFRKKPLRNDAASFSLVYCKPSVQSMSRRGFGIAAGKQSETLPIPRGAGSNKGGLDSRTGNGTIACERSVESSIVQYNDDGEEEEESSRVEGDGSGTTTVMFHGEQSRTLDLTFFTKEQRDIWYRGLIEAIKFCHEQASNENGGCSTVGEEVRAIGLDSKASITAATTSPGNIVMGDMFMWGSTSGTWKSQLQKMQASPLGLEAMVPGVVLHGDKLVRQSIRTEGGGYDACWPKSAQPRLVPANNLIDIRRASIGRRHGIIVSGSGQVYMFGEGRGGKLGLGHFEDVCYPQKIRHGLDITLESGIKQVACGEDLSAALSHNGHLFLWGKSGAGVPPMSIPYPWNTGHLANVKVSSISCGAFHCGAVTEDGRLFTWGEGLGGKLGLGDVRSRSTPTHVIALPGRVIKASCGVWHSAAIVDCSEPALETRGWGSHADAHIHSGSSKHQRNSSNVLGTFGTVVTPDVTIICHREGKGGRLFTWGGVNEAVSFGDGEQKRDSNKGCLGHGEEDLYTGQLFPKAVGGALEGDSVRDVAAGAHLTVVLTTAGSVYQMGTTGSSNIASSSGTVACPWEGAVLPVCVRGPLAGVFVDTISCGLHHVLVAGRSLEKRSGGPLGRKPNMVFAWGRGAEGQLGTSKLEDSSQPLLLDVFKGRKILDIACGGCSSALVCQHDSRRIGGDFSREAWDAASKCLLSLLEPQSSALDSTKFKSLQFKGRRPKGGRELLDDSNSVSRISLTSKESGNESLHAEISRPSKSIIDLNESSISGATSSGTLSVRRSVGQFASQHSLASNLSGGLQLPLSLDLESFGSGRADTSRYHNKHHVWSPRLQSPSVSAVESPMESLTSNDAQIPSRWRKPSNNSGRASFDDKTNSAKYTAISEGAQSSENSATKRYGLHLNSSHHTSPEKQSGVFKGEKTALNIGMQSAVNTAKDLQVEKDALEEQKRALAEWEAQLRQKEDALALQEQAVTLSQSSKSEMEQAKRLNESIGCEKDQNAWTEELDEGVTATFEVVDNGDAKLRRIRFSRSIFSPEGAAKWYEDHQDLVQSICLASSTGNTPVASPICHEPTKPDTLYHHDNTISDVKESRATMLERQLNMDESSRTPGKIRHGRLTSRNISFDVRELIQLHLSVRSDDKQIPTAQPREAEDDDKTLSEEDYHSISSAQPYKSEQSSIDIGEQIGPKSFALSSAAPITTSMDRYSAQHEESDDSSSNQVTSKQIESTNIFKSIFGPLLRS